jgi:hypothetical protein
MPAVPLAKWLRLWLDGAEDQFTMPFTTCAYHPYIELHMQTTMDDFLVTGDGGCRWAGRVVLQHIWRHSE